MTGGQMAPTTIPAWAPPPPPAARNVVRDGAPLDLTQMLADAKGSAFLARVSVATPKGHPQGQEGHQAGLPSAAGRPGLRLVEVLSPAPPTGKWDPVAAYEWTAKE